MILGNRQAFIGCANHPEIKRATEINIKGYESIKEVFTEAIMNKICHSYKYRNEKEMKAFPYNQEGINRDRKMFEDCIEQTINYLKLNKLLKPCKKIKSIKLWNDITKMSPYYEAVNVQLKTMLIKHHCPHMYEEINKGRVYSYYTLTQISEAVLYIMEYFYPRGLKNTISSNSEGI